MTFSREVGTLPDYPIPDPTPPGDESGGDDNENRGGRIRNSSGIDPRRLERTRAKEINLTTTARGRPLRFAWGRGRMSGQVFKHGVKGNNYYVGVAWGVGPFRSVELKRVFGDKELLNQISWNHYMGNPADGNYNTVDPLLLECDSNYTDTLVGSVLGSQVAMSYTSIRIPVWLLSGSVDVYAEYEGRMVYDPIGDQTVFSENPALIALDYFRHPLHANYTVDWTDAGTLDAIAKCDEAVPGDPALPRRQLNLVIDSIVSVADIKQTLRFYAGCFVRIEGRTVYLIPDRPVTYSIPDVTGILTKFSWERIAGAEKPNVIEASFENRLGDEWKVEQITPVEHPDVTAGTVERVPTSLRSDGFINQQMAVRQATELLNGYTLIDLMGTIETTDEGLTIEVGDVIHVSDPQNTGVTADLRILEKKPAELGAWTFEVEEYSDAKYSDYVVTGDSPVNTELPSPSDIPAPENLTVVEKVRKNNAGVWQSYLEISWTFPDIYPYPKTFDVQVGNSGGSIVFAISGIAEQRTATGLLVDGETYTVSVRGRLANTEIVSALWVSTNITVLSTNDVPPDVTGLSVIEVGGVVRVKWNEIVDVGTWEYVVAYGPVGVVWELATVDNVVSSLKEIIEDLPVGTYDILVKARTSGRLESTNEARATVVVTLDSDAFLVSDIRWTSLLTLNNVEPWAKGRLGGQYWYGTEGLISFGVLFPNQLNTYLNPLLSYDTVFGEADAVTAEFDLQTNINGSFVANIPILTYGGATIRELRLRAEGGAVEVFFVPEGADSVAAKGIYRYVAIAIRSSSQVFQFNLEEINVQVNAIAQVKDSGGVRRLHELIDPDTVYIEGNEYFTSAKSINLTVFGQGPYSWNIDNVVFGDKTKFSNARFEDWEGTGPDEKPVNWRNFVDTSQSRALMVKESSIVDSGNYALRLEQDGVTDLGIMTPVFAVTSGTLLRGEIRVYGVSTSTNGFYFRISEFDTQPVDEYTDWNSADRFTDIAANTPVALGWQTFSGNVQLASTCKFIVVSNHKVNNATGSVWIVDSIKLNINAFDVYVYDALGSRAAAEYTWEAKLV